MARNPIRTADAMIPAIAALGGHSLARAHTARQDTQRQLDAVIGRSPVGIAKTDLRGRYLLANPCYCEITGRSEAQLRRMRVQDTTHPDDRAQHDLSHARMLRTGKAFIHEKRYVRPDRTHVWVQSHVSVLHDAAGRPDAVLASVRDLSALRARDDSIATLRARGRRRADVLSQLAGGIAHEFNNVLQAVGGGARLMQRRPDKPETVARLSGLMLEAVERGALITQRLLSFARRNDAVMAPVHLRDVVRTLPAAGPTAFTTDIPDTLPLVRVDPEQLQLVLLAIMGAGGAHVRARAEPGAGGAVVVLTVVDPAHARPGGGASFGLAMAEILADQGNGTFDTRWAEGVGTVMTLRLPAA